MPVPDDNAAAAATAGLGLDGGGTGTRWALTEAGRGPREGVVGAISGLQLMSADGRARLAAALAEIATATRGAGPVRAVVAGVTGLAAEQAPLLASMLALALGIEAGAVRAMSDIELACHAAFAPGEGYVVYAGTGSIAAFIDASGTLHRAGGRGAVIDDAGSGHWIACQALQRVWRAEDETPGAWRTSRLAQRLFAQLGGTDWAHTRQWVQGATRGEVGALALAVAAAAPEDPVALALLHAAGAELARPACALIGRFGPRPLALAGRVFDLHPAVEQGLRAALPAGITAQRATQPAHHAAARLATGRVPA